jgi:hypothetical protein
MESRWRSNNRDRPLIFASIYSRIEYDRCHEKAA